jgi:mannose-6-phosphate isomerase
VTAGAPSLPEAAARLKAWMIEEALPFWWEHGADPEGGFYEAVAFDGTPCRDSVRRVRVQARQAYVYAHADALGWGRLGRAPSDHAFDHLLDKAARGKPGTEGFDGFVHRLAPDGAVADDRRDLYDHAFVLLACAYRIRAYDDERARAVADATLGFIDRTMTHPAGGYAEGVPPSSPRRQNPHMHLFEALLALHEATGESAYLARAEAIHDLFTRHFHDAGDSVILEFFTDEWGVDPERGSGLEPGHHAEWCWLLDRFEGMGGCRSGDVIEALLATAQLRGCDDASGFLIDETERGVSGPPRGSRRLWVQTEYLRALLTACRRGEVRCASAAATLISALFETYLPARLSGGYVDQFDADGRPVSTVMPTSTLYHLLGAAVEADRTAQAMSQR